ncbi:uncharacterized protein LOC128952993 [Oppia nitens]|uniref:uncharacterized protein LOC128952993 n=1 Tax=Oppia nitens TaxID=1686743 RepID=UPI0023DB765C|nr:uncharacterized protein LOC128952993 [Oppia nitens]
MGGNTSKCLITLDRPGVAYRPNDIISGQCVLQTEKPVPLSQLSVSLRGEARCQWTEQQQVHGRDAQGRPHNRSETVHYRSDHPCVKLKYYPGNVYPSTLSPGQHNIGFNFQLPSGGLPSTFEGQYGHIRYWIEAHLHKPGVFNIDDRARVPIIVNSPALSSIQELSQRVFNSNSKTVGLINGQPLVLRCELPSMGHNVGSEIPVQCFIDNGSDKPMILRAALKQESTFYARGCQRKTSVKIARYIGPNVGPREKTSQLLPLIIPLTAPVVQNTCPIIHLNYTVVVTLEIPGSFDLHCELPVILTHDIRIFAYTHQMGNTITKCIINLDRPGVAFRPNDLISGYCLIETNQPILVSQLSIKLKGQAECQWSESQTQLTSRNKSDIQHRMYLSCVDLNGLPSTFKGQYGYIRYWIEANLRNPDGLDNNPWIPVHIMSPALVSIQELTQRSFDSQRRTVRSAKGQYSVVCIQCEIGRMGHNAGENIPVLCYVDNPSDKILSLRAELRQESTFLSAGGRHDWSETLNETIPITIRSYTTGRTYDIQVAIPVLASVVQNSCPIIQVKYHVRVQLAIPGLWMDLFCKLPVIVTRDQCQLAPPPPPPPPLLPLPPLHTVPVNVDNDDVDNNCAVIVKARPNSSSLV